jgi:hypothetical protein
VTRQRFIQIHRVHWRAIKPRQPHVTDDYQPEVILWTFESPRQSFSPRFGTTVRRNWGWRFVDEFCWRKPNDGVPGRWNNRFKNAWEPVFHFCRQSIIKC